MKMISKLMTTSALLIAGALVSFGADMNAPATTKLADVKAKAANVMAKLADSDYMDALKSMTVEDFVRKVKDREGLMKFINNAKEKNPAAAKKIEDFLNKNKDKELKDLDKEKLKEALGDVVTALKAKRAEAGKAMNAEKKAAY